MDKKSRQYIEKVAKRVKDSAGRKQKYAKKTLAAYREYLENSGYDEDEITNMTSGGARRWQAERVVKARKSERVKYSTQKVYLYTQVVDGRKVKGRWYTHRAYQARVRTQAYWRDIQRLVEIYDYNTKEARELYRKVHDPKVSLEMRNKLIELLHESMGESPLKPGRDIGKRKKRGRTESMKAYWKKVRKIKSKGNCSLTQARRRYRLKGRA